MRGRLIAILGPTATGKSAVGLAVAERFGGEIINCDSTAVYRGFDIGTDKVAPADRRGIPHHLIDIADPTEDYTAARYAREAATVIRDIHARGRLPVLVGGTGFYYRALTRGLFPGPGRDAALRQRLESIAERRGAPFLHHMLWKVDPPSGVRIQPRDLKRLVRALEVFFLTGRALTAHFSDTMSPIPDVDVTAIALRLPAAQISERVTRRVDEQVAVAAPDQVGVRAIGGGRVVTAAVYAWRELLREQVRWLRAMTFAAYRRSWTHQHRAPGGDFFFLAGRLAGEHRFALAANDQPGRNVARSSAIDAAAIDVPVAGSRRWIAVSELCHLRAMS